MRGGGDVVKNWDRSQIAHRNFYCEMRELNVKNGKVRCAMGVEVMWQRNGTDRRSCIGSFINIHTHAINNDHFIGILNKTKIAPK